MRRRGSLNVRNAVENNNARPRRTDRNPLWAEAQIRQDELNGARIRTLIGWIIDKGQKVARLVTITPR